MIWQAIGRGCLAFVATMGFVGILLRVTLAMDEWWGGVVLWALPVGAGIYEGRRAYRQGQRRERVRRGLECATCGYDLRASTSRCPECGQFIRLPLEGRLHD